MTVTILTPTYNRGYILNNAYISLCNQTNYDFEWIIVDDGSTDNTEELVKSWIVSHPPFELRYFKQKNGGKHRAVNRGVMEARSGYVLILDSDDYLTVDCVEKIHVWVDTIDGQDGFAGVSGLRGWINSSEHIGGNGDGRKFIDAKNTERRKFNLSGDKAEVYKTEILKKYPFPEFEGENFLSEHVVWDTIAKDGYKIRWFNEIIYKCEYLDDGLTKSKSFKLQTSNFQGFTTSTRIRLELDPFPWNYFSIGLFLHVAKLKGMSFAETKKLLGVSYRSLLVGYAIFMANEFRKKIK